MVEIKQKISATLHEAKKERVSYVFILPSVLLFLLFVLYPLVKSVVMSFQQVNLVTSSWVGLANYKDIFTDDIFWIALKNTALFVAILVPFTIFMAFQVSVVTIPLKKGYQSFLRAAFYLPVVVSGVMVSLIWLWIFNPSYGLLNYVIGFFGIEPVEWLASKNTIYYLMFVVFSFNFGVPFIIYVAALSNIPNQIYEAARIDGASRRTIKWRITFPLLKATTFFLFITNTIAVFQVWVVIQLLTNGGPAHTTETIVYQLYINAFRFNQFGRASAMGMVLMLIILFITFIQKRIIGDDVEY
jgi:multiple sugar transport system permease protein